jgi:2-iminobutanoate/2-iminopropanoate deaminase
MDSKQENANSARSMDHPKGMAIPVEQPELQAYESAMRPHIINPAASPKPVGPYSHAVRVGDLLFCSGQIPLNAQGQLVAGGIKEQTQQVLQNVAAILKDQSLQFENVVKATVFMVDLSEFADMNAVYSEFFRENFPARSTVQVAALPRGARVEIEVVACYATP